MSDERGRVLRFGQIGERTGVCLGDLADPVGVGAVPLVGARHEVDHLCRAEEREAGDVRRAGVGLDRDDAALSRRLDPADEMDAERLQERSQCLEQLR